jgi:hypothetical protein
VRLQNRQRALVENARRVARKKAADQARSPDIRAARRRSMQHIDIESAKYEFAPATFVAYNGTKGTMRAGLI